MAASVFLPCGLAHCGLWWWWGATAVTSSSMLPWWWWWCGWWLLVSDSTEMTQPAMMMSTPTTIVRSTGALSTAQSLHDETEESSDVWWDVGRAGWLAYQ